MKHIVPVFALIVGIAVLGYSVQLAYPRHSHLQPEEQLVSRYYKSVTKLTDACARHAGIPAKAAFCRRLGVNDSAAVLRLEQDIRKTVSDGFLHIATATVNDWERQTEVSLKLLEQ
jgi:hypothetical protein